MTQRIRSTAVDPGLQADPYARQRTVRIAHPVVQHRQGAGQPLGLGLGTGVNREVMAADP